MTDSALSFFEAIAIALTSYNACQQHGNVKWREIRKNELENLCKEHLPSGSGFDNPVNLNHDESAADKLVFEGSYHCMNEDGYYTHWQDFRVTVTPSFVSGVNVSVDFPDCATEKDYSEDQCILADYIADMFYDLHYIKISKNP